MRSLVTLSELCNRGSNCEVPRSARNDDVMAAHVFTYANCENLRKVS